MKKIVYINFRQLHTDLNGKHGTIDSYLFDEYELRCISSSWRYTVEDESKLVLFMLKHSQYIYSIKEE